MSGGVSVRVCIYVCVVLGGSCWKDIQTIASCEWKIQES